MSVTRRPRFGRNRTKQSDGTKPKYVFDMHKMNLAHGRNPMNQPIMKADIEARYPSIGSNGNQGTAQIPSVIMYDDVEHKENHSVKDP